MSETAALIPCLPLTAAQRATLLAGIACLMRHVTQGNLPDDVRAIATDNGARSDLTVDAVDNLELLITRAATNDEAMWHVPVVIHVSGAHDAAAAALYVQSMMGYADEVANEPADDTPHMEFYHVDVVHTFKVLPATPPSVTAAADTVQDDAPIENGDWPF